MLAFDDGRCTSFTPHTNTYFLTGRAGQRNSGKILFDRENMDVTAATASFMQSEDLKRFRELLYLAGIPK